MPFPKLAHFLNSLAGRLNNPPAPSLPYSQARTKLNQLPQFPPPQQYQSMGLILSQLNPKERQQLMLALYHGNFLNHDVIRKTVNPICGFPGFQVNASADTPTLTELVKTFMTYNKLGNHRDQQLLTTSYVIMGELLVLCAPMDQTLFVQPVSPLLISQTLSDPENPYEIMAVVLEPSLYQNSPYLYKVIVPDESRFSAAAQAIRAQIELECFYTANFEDYEFEDAPANYLPKALFPDAQSQTSWTRRQRRGKPWLFTSSDLFDHLTTTLWGMLDKMRDGLRFNYDFTVMTEEPDPSRSIPKVKAVADSIGIPEQGQPFFHDERTKMTPISFPLTSGDIGSIMDTMFKLSGMSMGIAPYDMGSENANLATAKSQGSPAEQVQADIQADIEDWYVLLTTQAMKGREQVGAIPLAELKALDEAGTRSTYGLTVTSPELATKNLASLAQVFNLHVQSLSGLAQLGLWNMDSIAEAGKQLSQEVLGLTIEPLTEEEKAEQERKAQKQMQMQQQMQAQKAGKQAISKQEQSGETIMK